MSPVTILTFEVFVFEHFYVLYTLTCDLSIFLMFSKSQYDYGKNFMNSQCVLLFIFALNEFSKEL